MPWPSFVLAVVAAAELSILALLRLKYGNDCSGNYQRRQQIILVRGGVVHESEPLSSNAVADALLMLAVAKHVKGGDIRRHIELAQVAKEEMASGIECGAMEDSAREQFIKMLKNKRA